MTNPFPDEKFWMNKSAGFYEEPGNKERHFFDWTQAAAEQASKRQSLMALCHFMQPLSNHRLQPDVQRHPLLVSHMRNTNVHFQK